MEAIFESDGGFVDFGRDWLMPYERTSASRVAGGDKESLREAVRKRLPKDPGIYGFVNGDGKLIYVGKSKSLRSRVLSYFLPTNADEKAGQIAEAAREVLWETQPSEFAALLREQKLISRWQPRYNVVGMPRRQRAAYLCLGHGPADCFYVSTKVDKKSRASEGPFFGMNRLARAAEILNRLFRLRDCSDKTGFVFRDQLTLFDDPRRPGCLRVEMGTCLGPCAAVCSKAQYEVELLRAIAFLKGGDVELLDRLEADMNRAAARLHFERATRLREDWLLMQWLTRKLLQNEQARTQYNFIYPVAAADGRDIWYLIRGGKVEHAVARPRNATQWNRCREDIRQWFGSRNRLEGCYDGGDDTLHIVAAWFRKQRDQLRLVRNLADLPEDYADGQSAGPRETASSGNAVVVK